MIGLATARAASMRGSSRSEPALRDVAQRFSAAIAGLKACVTYCLVLALGTSARAAVDLRLIEAVKNRDTAQVRALLEQRPSTIDVNATQGDGATALHWAAHRDDL